MGFSDTRQFGAQRKGRRHRTPRFESLERRELLAGDLAITEFLASNSDSLVDSDGNTSDWIEVHNTSSEPVDLLGWTLSDDQDDVGKWEFPPLTIAPDQYLMVFASGKDRRWDSFRLVRDMNASADATFAIDLPDGEYALRVTMGDTDRGRDQMAIYAQGTLIDMLSTAAGEFAVREAVTEVSAATGGQLRLRIEDQGGTSTRAVINALTITPTAGGAPLRFDFGNATSPVEPGYVGIEATDTYAAAVGHGWLPGPVISSPDRGLSKDEPHTDFKLAAQGGYLALTDPAGVVVSEFGPDGTYYPRQFVDVSYGVAADGIRYFLHPTPAAPNGAGHVGFTEQPLFSVAHGFYSAPLSVDLSTPTPDATIRYTTDGTEPTFVHGTVYTAPITVTATTTLRAAAFGDDLLPSPVETQTYLFLADVVHQSPLGEPPLDFPAGSVNGQSLDYGMDPVIVGNPVWGSQLQAALTAVPTFSIVTDAANLFDRQTGIYVNANRHGEAWERSTSVELINPDGSSGFQIDAGLRIRGGFSRSGDNPKHAFRLLFRSAYGESKLEYPLFEQEGVDQFESIDLRTTQNYSWSFQGDRRNTFLRDIFSRDVQRDLGQPYTRGRYYHLYINGQYWGLYQTEERPESAYAASYFGGDSDDYDVVKSAGSSGGYQVEATDGNLDAYHRLYLASRTGFADNADYFRVQGMNPDGSRNPDYERLLDADNLIDYMIITYYTGDKDGPGSRFTAPRPNNFFGIYDREDPDGFKWFEHDSEHTLDVGESNMVRPLVTDHSGFNEANEAYFNPHWLHEKLTENAEYRQRFADRVQRAFASGGALSNSHTRAIIDQHAAEIETAMIAESARWGDAKRATPYTQTDWAGAVATVRGWLPTRIDRVLNQLRGQGWFPQIAAPILSTPGGLVPASTEVSLTAGSDAIYYMIDADDPRQLGGEINPNAIVYDQPIVVTQSQRIRARALRDGQWSALSEVVYGVAMPLRITELNYHPAAPMPWELAADPTLDNEQFEFIELVNAGDRSIDLSTLQFTDGIEFAFADGDQQSLDAGQVVLIVSDRAAFEMRYGDGLPVTGQFAGHLSNGGEHLRIEDRLGIVVQEFAYDDKDPWPTRGDGSGSSLEVIATAGNYADPANWRASSQFGGTPGVPAAAARTDVIINEVFSRDGPGEPDRIELLNMTTGPIDVSNWYVSDTADDPLKSHLPLGTIIGPRQYLEINASELALTLDGTAGGQLWLLAAQPDGRPTRYADHVRFDATDPGVSLGRWPNGDPSADLFPMTAPSLGAGNRGAVSGPVVISEIAFHAAIDPLAAADFSDGMAGGFSPKSGSWNVVDNTYQAIPDAAGDGDTVATLTVSEPLPRQMVLSATVNIPTNSDTRKNGALIFDYRGPQDFKFLLLPAGSDLWRLGHRDANGWNFLAEVAGLIETGTDMEVAIEIDGSVATARMGSTQMVQYEFGTPLNLGQVGLGSKLGTVRFDDVKLEYAGEPRDFDFVELAAASAEAVDLGGWQLTGEVDWSFASGTTVAPGEPLVLVIFDPDDAGWAEVFRQAYGIEPSVRLEGPYQGVLGDVGGTVRLVKPALPSGPEQGVVLVDRITYTDTTPWPESAAGGGDSLARARAVLFGNLATSWYAATPSPGEANSLVAGDMNLDGVVNGDDVAGIVEALVDPLSYWAEHGRAAALTGDMDNDGDVDFDDIDLFVAQLRGQVAVTPLPTTAASDALVGSRGG